MWVTVHLDQGGCSAFKAMHGEVAVLTAELLFMPRRCVPKVAREIDFQCL